MSNISSTVDFVRQPSTRCSHSLPAFSLISTPTRRTVGENETLETPTDEPTHRVILYNDEWHSVDEVVLQLRKATGYDIYKATAIMLEAHTKGRAVCFRGDRTKCQRVAGILRQIRLQVEVDCD